MHQQFCHKLLVKTLPAVQLLCAHKQKIISQDKTKCSFSGLEIDYLSSSVFLFLQSWQMFSEIFLMFQAKVFYCFSHQKHLLFFSLNVKGRKTSVKHKLFILKGNIEIERLLHFLKPLEICFLLLMRAPRFQHNHGLLKNWNLAPRPIAA